MTDLHSTRHSSFVLRHFLLTLCISAGAALAQGPHEIALIVNARSPDSIEIAHHYAHLRQIPPANLIYLELPDSAWDIRAETSLENFNRWIVEPVQREIESRKIADHILAWVYSADFPFRVTTPSPMSLTGATFTRGEFPPREQVDQGTYRSPFFRGPDRPDIDGAPPGSLQEFAMLLKEEMPRPAMWLGHTGSRGLPAETLVAGLRRAAAADGTQPRDSVFFHLSEDIRVKCRSWQFEPAARELKEIGLAANVSSNPPPSAAPLSGLMLGAAFTDAPWGRLQPGSLVDNLTSLAGYFYTHEQTKLTHWLAQGAAASAGTVTEPLSIWTKFPHARVFAHYARGCTLLESYLQAVRSPLQLLLVGDPLCKPWSRPAPIALVSLEDTKKPLRGEASFVVSPLIPIPGATYLFLLDGRSIPAGGRNTGLRFDTRELADGYHELQAVLYTPGPIRRQGHARLGFTVNNQDRFARLALSSGTNSSIALHQAINLRVQAAPGATGLVLAAYGRPVWSGSASTQEQHIAIAATDIGPGPAILHAIASFPDAAPVHSAPVSLTIVRTNAPPAPPRIAANAETPTPLRAESTDPDGDPVTLTWFSDLLASPRPDTRIRMGDGAWILSHPEGTIAIPLGGQTAEGTTELVATLRLDETRESTGEQLGGIAFNFRDERNYDCFGWHWQESGWILGRVENGRLIRIASRGAPAPAGLSREISLRREGNGLSAWVDDKCVVRTERLQLGGLIGLIGGQSPLTITHLGAALATGVEWDSETSPGVQHLWVRASDSSQSRWAAHTLGQ